MRADSVVTLRWTGGGLEFDGTAGGDADGPTMRLDGSGAAGPSPVTMLLLSLGGCSGADVVEILGKMRVPLEDLVVRVEGERAETAPRRFTRVHVTYALSGVSAESRPQVERAVALSQDKYCSVLHTIRPDVELSSEILLR